MCDIMCKLKWNVVEALFVEEQPIQWWKSGNNPVGSKLTEIWCQCVFLPGATYPMTTNQELRRIHHQAKRIATDTSWQSATSSVRFPVNRLQTREWTCSDSRSLRLGIGADIHSAQRCLSSAVIALKGASRPRGSRWKGSQWFYYSD